MVSLYQIINLKNSKRYIGKTCLTAAQRWRKHCKDARAGRPWAISRAVRKYGADSFAVEVLFSASTEREANAAEIALIAAAHSNDPEYGYNNTLGGDGFSDPTPEFKARRAATLKATFAKPDVKARCAAHRWGKGLPVPNERKDISTDVVVALYASGKSPREISKMLSFGGVGRRLVKAGVHIRSRVEVRLGRPVTRG